MTHLPELWSVIDSYLARDRWHDLNEVYRHVERSVSLDDEDMEPDAPNSNGLRWHRNVRNVLQYRKGTREIKWNGAGGY